MQDKQFKRQGLGGVDIGVSSNPSFHRGMLKGLSRTIMAGKQGFAAVCKVNYGEKKQNGNCSKGQTEDINPKENGIRKTDS